MSAIEWPGEALYRTFPPDIGMKANKECYLFDIDGTLANHDHRSHFVEGKRKNFDCFYALMADDIPIEPVCTIFRALARAGHIRLCVTGRPEQYRMITKRWLDEYDLSPTRLYMRKDEDRHVDDALIKQGMLDQIIRDGFKPVMAFDNRNKIVEVWRRNGLICAQVAEGDF